MNSLAQMAKANRVSNKVVKAKKAAKAKRATEFQRDHDDATNMDTELTKLENIAAKEEAKLAKEVAKEAAQIAHRRLSGRGVSPSADSQTVSPM
jgi:hypothetical protein